MQEIERIPTLEGCGQDSMAARLRRNSARGRKRIAHYMAD